MKYEIMFYGGLVITLITLILAIISFLKLNVAEALCDLVGINFKAKRISKSNKSNKEKRKYSNLSRRIKPDITVRKEKKNNIEGKDIEENKNIKPRYDYNNLDEESTTLQNDEDTTLLDEENTTLLDGEETTIISEDAEETMLIEEDNGFSEKFINEVDIVLVNSDEII